jgi:hypothetical protein
MSVSYGGDSITFGDGSIVSSGSQGFKNKIINGAMVIDQRNAGSTITPANASLVYTLDRWFAYQTVASKFSLGQNAGSVTPPAGFSNYLGITSLSSYTVASTDYFFIGQYIEGFNFSDLSWGTADAKSITISFWVRSSLTGTFGGGLQNSAQNRSLAFSYTINSANTWEYKTITIAGDTTGTWVGATNGIGLRLWISVGMGSTNSGTGGVWGTTDIRSVPGATNVVGTNGATFYITGFQLEKGTTASTFEFRSYQKELMLCQRYCYAQYGGSGDRLGFGWSGTATLFNMVVPLPVTMRATPTLTSCSAGAVNDNQQAYNSSAITIGDSITNTCVYLKVTSSGMTIGRGAQFYFSSAASSMILSAEL